MAHHAYLVVGQREVAVRHAFSLFGIEPEMVRGNPDIQMLAYAQFGIDDARDLKERAESRPIKEPYRVFVVAAEAILGEAQNALLKLFEEPPVSSKFAVILPEQSRVLPTLRSRFETHVLTDDIETTRALAFLKLSPGERLREIADHTKEKDGAWIDALLASLATYLRAQAAKGGSGSVNAPLRALAFVERRLGDRGSSPKMLLEYLALSLPTL